MLFDFTGLSDRLAPALTLAVADYVEWHVHRLRRARVAGELDGHGPWAGKSQLIIEEGWKPLSSPAAGAWLNEYARRARHYALWLTFITQFFRDFDSEQGRSMLSNHAVALCLPNERRDLEHARDSLALTDTDIAEITSLPSQKGSYSTLYMISKRGRGAIRIAPGAPEYWIASSNPELDQPLRHAALRETGGDPWKALTRLCDPGLARAPTPATGSRAMTVTVPSGRRSRTKLIWLVPAVGFMIVLAPVVLLAGAGNPPCTSIAPSPTGLPVGSGAWIATAYGPPWDAINGSGVTATGLNLTAGQPAYEIAVDPAVIPLRSFAHVTPNPFGTPHAFYAGDTGGAIIGTPRRHLRLARPRRPGRVGRPARRPSPRRPNPGTGSLLGEITPTAAATQPATAGSGSRRVLGGRGAAAAHPGPDREDPAKRARGRAARRAACGQARDRRRQPAHRQALHLGRRPRPAAHPARRRLRLLGLDQLRPPRRRLVR